MRCGRAGCPLYPGGDGVPRDHRDVRDRRLPPCNGWPLPPRCHCPTRDVKLTRHQQGFTVIHPSGLPLTCNTRSERAASGFPLSFAPGRYQPGTSGRGRVWNTNPKSRLRHHAESPIDGTHSQRATSCRTILVCGQGRVSQRRRESWPRQDGRSATANPAGRRRRLTEACHRQQPLS